jgi:hypothetical protein
MAIDFDTYDINDIVTCRLREGFVTSKDDKYYDDTITLKIIGAKYQPFEVDEFIVYVPDYELARLQTGARVNSYLSKEFCIESKFLGDYMTFIRPRHIVNVAHKADGKFCENCDEFFEMAGSNRENGVFICHSCSENPWR